MIFAQVIMSCIFLWGFSASCAAAAMATFLDAEEQITSGLVKWGRAKTTSLLIHSIIFFLTCCVVYVLLIPCDFVIL
jgi:hypothetical protein